MKHLTALLIKWIMTTAILWMVLGGLFGVPFVIVLFTSLLLTVAAYLVGDCFVFPKLGNVAALMADFALTFLGIWALGFFLFAPSVPLTAAALITAAFIPVGETFFHLYMKRRILNRSSPDLTPNDSNLQTEFGSDMDVRPEQEKMKDQKDPTE